MDLYIVYNLPALHLELKVQFSYVLEGEYLAISALGTYASMPRWHEIHVCLATQGHLCVLNTGLHLVEKIKWFVHVLFIKDLKLIKTHCLVDSHTWHANLAQPRWLYMSSQLYGYWTYTNLLLKGNLYGDHYTSLNAYLHWQWVWRLEDEHQHSFKNWHHQWVRYINKMWILKTTIAH